MLKSSNIFLAVYRKLTLWCIVSNFGRLSNRNVGLRWRANDQWYWPISHNQWL